MRYPLVALAAVAAALGAFAPAFAQGGNPNVAYQNALLARALTPDVKAYCDAKVGPQAPNNQAAYDPCRVTRAFLADINAKQDRGFPPMADISYASKAEMSQILDAMSKYGG